MKWRQRGVASGLRAEERTGCVRVELGYRVAGDEDALVGRRGRPTSVTGSNVKPSGAGVVDRARGPEHQRRVSDRAEPERRARRAWASPRTS